MYGPLTSSYGHPDAVEARGAARDAADAEALADGLDLCQRAGKTLEPKALEAAEFLSACFGDDDQRDRLILMCAAGHPEAQAQCQAWVRAMVVASVEAA